MLPPARAGNAPESSHPPAQCEKLGAVMRISPLLAALTIVTACADNSPLVTAPASPPGSVPTPIPADTLSEHMDLHYARAFEARDAVVRGDLQALKPPSRWLADHKRHPALPDTWRPYMDEAQVAAEQAASARTVTAAATALAEMATTCGACHLNLGQGPAVQSSVGDPMAGDRAALASWHLRAAIQMWDGLVAPSDKAWMEAAAALGRAPLLPSELPGASRVTPDALGLE